MKIRTRKFPAYIILAVVSTKKRDTLFKIQQTNLITQRDTHFFKTYKVIYVTLTIKLLSIKPMKSLDLIAHYLFLTR